MRRATTLMSRELTTYFQSPLAYVLAALFLLIVSVMVYMQTGGFSYMSPKDLVAVMIMWSSIFMIIIAPILTMRLMAGEKDSGAIEILVTDPVTDWDIVLGKFLAALLCLLAMVLPLFLYVVLFAMLRKPTDAPLDWGALVSGAVGLLCVLALSAAIGLLASSLTRNQVVSALIGFVVLLTFWLAGAFLPAVLSGWGPQWREAAEALSLYSRLRTLLDGQLDLKSLFFYVSTAALVLYLSVRAVESRKWR
jgi:ABC-2 type transport system permease protein